MFWVVVIGLPCATYRYYACASILHVRVSSPQATASESIHHVIISLCKAQLIAMSVYAVMAMRIMLYGALTDP